MNWRLASRFSVLTMALLIVLVVAVLGARTHLGGTTPGSSFPTTNSSGLQGTDLGGTPAPDFRLTDQFGKPISLSQFKGKPVILTFLYTHCPDQCPLTAEKLHAVMQNLGDPGLELLLQLRLRLVGLVAGPGELLVAGVVGGGDG